MRLNNKVALVTGAASGIGLATALRFAREGASVVLADISADALEQAVADWPSDRVASVSVDVTRPEQVEAMVQTTLDRFGGLDVLVANAGIEGEVGEIADGSLENFDNVMGVNVRLVDAQVRNPRHARARWRQHPDHFFGSRRQGAGQYGAL